MWIELIEDVRELSIKDESALEVLKTLPSSQEVDRAIASYMKKGKIKRTIRPNRGTNIQWKKGAQINVSEETGKKLISRKQAKEIKAPTTTDVELVAEKDK